MVVVMILIGGYTRLTNSGLSIVEWKPITGIVPPLSLEDWESEFGKYQVSPEFKLHNSDMTLTEFKFIFWLEYTHRLAGRITGLLFLLPLLYFYARGQIGKCARWTYLGVLALLAMQGFMGWYMVKSGLSAAAHVSHFRLAAHLLLAAIIYSLLFWQLMKNSFDILLLSSKINMQRLKILSMLAIIILFVQIFLGGMVAGLDGGLVYNSFPLMGNSFVPTEVSYANISCNDFSNPVFVQFIHRSVACVLTFIIFILIINLLQLGYPRLRRVAIFIGLACALQLLAGILTLLLMVPISMALIHQGGAILLLSSLLWCYFLLSCR